MATVFAYSVVRRLNSKGEVEEYRPGEKLPVGGADGFDKDEIAHLLATGAAATYDMTKTQAEQVAEQENENQQLRSRIKELEDQLAESTKAAASSKSDAPSSASMGKSTGSSANK